MTKKQKKAISRGLKKYWKSLDDNERKLRLEKLIEFNKLSKTAIKFYIENIDIDVGNEYTMTESYY